MARRARNYIPGLPYHIVQRGNNKSKCFFDAEDFNRYLDLWKTVSQKYQVDVHAYCLMSNHIHFLITPQLEHSISDTMKVVGSTYAQFINKKYDRTGTLWEGRHRPSLVQSEKYLLTCYRYIELNPVRAKLVEYPHEYSWSSHLNNVQGNFSWLKPHEIFLALANTACERSKIYAAQFGMDIPASELALFRNAAHYCQPFSDEDFKLNISKRYGLTFGQMHMGRPRLVKK